MRGPLLSGPLGSPAALERVCQIVRAHPPTVVLSALWLAETLSEEIPVLALVEDDKRSAGRRAMRRTSKSGRPLLVVAAGEDVPLGRASVGSILVENLVDIEEPAAAEELLAGLMPALRPDGVVISLDATKNPAMEARLAGMFLGAALTGITQLRPREGALLTIGTLPHPAIVAARLRPI